ncbi:MAG: hypothetical protein KIS92_00845 [Planctomycetota bacterium]|nr:hypothetical protein [Planctomycetota bacterium]
MAGKKNVAPPLVVGNEHAGKPVTVAGLSGEIVFECIGPGANDCSVLVKGPKGNERKFVKRSDVALVEPPREA